MDDQNEKRYDLEERTFLFAKNVRALVKKLPKTIINIEDGKQLVKASGSVGANYIEANETRMQTLHNKNMINMRVPWRYKQSY
jgi:four helix bundle protein